MSHELSKSEISRRVGVTYTSTCHYVQGAKRPSRERAERFCEVMGYEFDELWTYKRKPVAKGGAS